MAVGDNGLTLTSAGGTTWQTIATGATNFLYSATGSTNDWLVAGDSELWLKDAPSWSESIVSGATLPGAQLDLLCQCLEHQRRERLRGLRRLRDDRHRRQH